MSDVAPDRSNGSRTHESIRRNTPAAILPHALSFEKPVNEAKPFFHGRRRFPRHQHLPPESEKCDPRVPNKVSPMSRAAQLVMTEAQPTLYAGLSHVTYDGEPLDLGHGIILRSTYAHLFAANMVAFARATNGKPHPAPWYAARGGFSYDVEAELAVPTSQELPGRLNAEDAVWLIAALLRLARYAYLMVPVISDVSFDAAPTSKQKPLLRPFEIEPRILHAGDDEVSCLQAEDLSWVKSVWPRTAELTRTCPPLSMALRAADACTVQGRRASALLTAWGALEVLFAPSRAELRFRVSAHIAAYLEPVGPKRLELFKTVADLYNARSKAAHTAQDAEVVALVQSFVILRNALVRMIDEGAVPMQADLEKRLFCGDGQ